MTLQIGTLLEIRKNDKTCILRIVYIDVSSRKVYLIDTKLKVDMNDPAWFISESLDSLEAQIEASEISLTHEDPFIQLFARAESEISKSDKEHREKFWLVFQPHVYDTKLLLASERDAIIRKIAKTLQITTKTARKWMRQFIKSGFAKNALLPRTFNQGGRGKRRYASKTGDRLGRFRNTERGNQELAQKGTAKKMGIPITPLVEQQFSEVFESYNKSGKHRVQPQTFIQTEYQRVLRRFFRTLQINVKGEEELNLLPESERPSYDQYRNWRLRYLTDGNNRERMMRSRFGNRHFETNTRSLLGRAADIARAPGMLDVIDATNLHIQFVSSKDPNQRVGRGELHIIVDFNCSFIKDALLVFEGENYPVFAILLANAYSSKVARMAELGISITDDDYPYYISHEVIVDRGPGYVASASNTIPDNLGTTISNARARRPELRGPVEKMMDIIYKELVAFLPGATLKLGESPDSYSTIVSNATYTVHEFEQVLFDFIMVFNRFRVLDNYPLLEEMYASHVDPIPLSLVRWSNAHLGRLRQESGKKVRLSLLPSEIAKITRRGIIFRGVLRYTCQLAIDQKWFDRAADGIWDIEVVYHPHTVNVIYIPPNSRYGIDEELKCSLINSIDMELYRDCTLAEFTLIVKDRKNQNQRLEEEEMNQSFAFHDRVEVKNKDVIKRRKKEMKSTPVPSKSGAVREISKNRQQERTALQSGRLWAEFRPDEPKTDSFDTLPQTNAFQFDKSAETADKADEFEEIAKKKRSQWQT